MALIGLYFLNGLDTYTTYGFLPKPGTSDEFLKRPAYKERYSNEWDDEDGTEWDLLSTPKKKDRVFNLTGYIFANSAAQFWSRYNALYAVFDAPGTQTIRVGEFSDDPGHAAGIKVFLLETPNIKRWTRLKDYGGRRAVELTLKLQEVSQTSLED